MARQAPGHNRRLRVVWIDARRILPLHEIRRPHHFRELVERMRRYGWQGRPLAVEALSGGRTKLRASGDGHYMGWTGTHRLAAARALGIKVPVILINGGKASRQALVRRTTTDRSRLMFLRRRRDPAADLMLAELRINRAADAHGRL